MDILWVIWTWRQKGESKYTSWVFFWLEVSTKCLWYSSTSFDWSQWTCCLSDLNSFLILLLRDLSSIPQNGVDGVLVPCFHSTSACNQAALNLWSGWKVEMTSVLLVFRFWHSSCKGRLNDSAFSVLWFSDTPCMITSSAESIHSGCIGPPVTSFYSNGRE